MKTLLLKDKQDLTYLKWSHIRSSSGTAGTFLKSESTIGGVKKYYKLSNFDSVNGVIGHECILEDILSEVFIDKIWNMIYERYQIYENL